MFTDLRWNNIGLLGGRSLLEALQKNQSIVQLEMAGNNIPSDTLRALGSVCVCVCVCVCLNTAYHIISIQFFVLWKMQSQNFTSMKLCSNCRLTFKICVVDPMNTLIIHKQCNPIAG